MGARRLCRSQEMRLHDRSKTQLITVSGIKGKVKLHLRYYICVYMKTNRGSSHETAPLSTQHTALTYVNNFPRSGLGEYVLHGQFGCLLRGLRASTDNEAALRQMANACKSLSVWPDGCDAQFRERCVVKLQPLQAPLRADGLNNWKSSARLRLTISTSSRSFAQQQNWHIDSSQLQKMVTCPPRTCVTTKRI